MRAELERKMETVSKDADRAERAAERAEHAAERAMGGKDFVEFCFAVRVTFCNLQNEFCR